MQPPKKKPPLKKPKILTLNKFSVHIMNAKDAIIGLKL